MSEEKKLNQNKKKSNNKNIYKILCVVFIIAFLITVGLMVRNWWIEKEAQKQFEALSNQTEQAATEQPNVLDELGITVPEKNLDWEELKETNEHIYAWIYIPNTNVDYPILQHPTDDTYYLDYNLDGTKGYPGCIYSEHRYNTTDFTDFNTLLYGHNMKNGTMFHTLHNFEDSTFFDENRYIFVYTPETVYVYDIFAAYANEATHILVVYDNETERGRQEYLDDLFGIRNMSAHFRDDIEVTTDSNILTLVTCISGKEDQRYFVQGVLLNPPVEETE